LFSLAIMLISYHHKCIVVSNYQSTNLMSLSSSSILYSKKLWRGNTLTNLAIHNNSLTFFHQFSCFCNMRCAQQRELQFICFAYKDPGIISILLYWGSSSLSSYSLLIRILVMTTDHRLYSAPCQPRHWQSSNNTQLARSSSNPGKYGVRFIMFINV